MHNISIRAHHTIRVLSVPCREKPPPPIIVITAETKDSTTTVPLDPDPEVYVFYPGEGFEGLDLPECFIGRVKRLKQVINWQVIVQRTIELIGVDTNAEIDPQNPQVIRAKTVLATGTQVTTWHGTNYGPTELVPPLEQGLIPDCGGYFDLYAHYSERIFSVIGELPVLNPDLCKFEAERVMAKFAWDDFDMEYGKNSKGVFPHVRAMPLTQEKLTNFVYPHDCSRVYNGNCQTNEQYLWVPPSPGELVNDLAWRVEVQQWGRSIDWWGMIARIFNLNLDTMYGFITITYAADADYKPTWKVTVEWKENINTQALVTLVCFNRAENRLVKVSKLPDGGFKETRQLWRTSWHPETGEHHELMVLEGDRIISQSPAYPPKWKVEAYEQTPGAT